jgi:hypothetical protein
MTVKLLYGTVHQIIHVVLVVDKILEFPEIDDIAEKMRAHILSKSGEQDPNIVIVHGDRRETLHPVGETHPRCAVQRGCYLCLVVTDCS